MQNKKGNMHTMNRPVRFLTATLFFSLPAAFADTYEAPLAVRSVTDAKLTGGVRVTRNGPGATISFETSEPVDVEVAILNSKGGIVRHLAAGLLGPHAPTPLKKNSLKQDLVWDGQDDAGQPATGAAPYAARVRLGAKPRFEKHLGWNGNRLNPINAMACSPEGELYLLMHPWGGRGRVEMRVLDREGKYKRTIMPYAANTPAAQTESVGQLTIDQRRVPVVFNGHAHSLYPLTVGMRRQTLAWNPQGHLVAVSSPGTAFETGLPRHLLAFHPAGGAPVGTPFVGPEIRTPVGLLYGSGEGKDVCMDNTACSPDGKYVYYTGSTYLSRHAVFRLYWGEGKGEGMEAAFFGEDGRPGADDRHLNDPQGMAVDRDGNLFICDRGNNRVAIVNPAGEFVDAFPVEDPEQIAIHPRTGHLYLVCRQRAWGGPRKDTSPMSMDEYRAWKARNKARMARISPRRSPRLLKLDAWKKGAPPAELIRLEDNVDLMALDPRSDPPRLWVTIGHTLTPLTENGKTFARGKRSEGNPGLYYPGFIQADPARNRVLVRALGASYKVNAVDLTTGAKTSFLRGASEIALAPDGTIVASGTYGSGALLRFDPDGQPLPWPGQADNRLTGIPFNSLGLGLGQRGLTVAPNGDIYFVRANESKGVASRVDVFGPDGKKKRDALVDGMGLGDCGIGVDATGNVYLGVNVKPAGKLYPAEFEGKIPPHNWLSWAMWNYQYRDAPWDYSLRNEYLYHLGAVMKFGPEGGAFYGLGSFGRPGAKTLPTPMLSAEQAPTDATEYLSGYLYERIKVAGAQWRYAGMGIVPSSERKWGDNSCVCMTSRLAVDGFGRVFAPNVFLFCVDMLDTDGNRIARIGDYGNADDRAGAFFAWPAFVDVADDKLYVADSVNNRLSIVAFDYHDEATVAIDN
jgi:DNA-binding beta-propeller fold protein YncE